MEAAERDELLAYRTPPVSLALALPRVHHHAFHLLTRRQATVCVPTLTGVHQRRNAPLDGLAARVLRVHRAPLPPGAPLRPLAVSVGPGGGGVGGAGAVHVETAELLVHAVGVAVRLVAWHAQVKVLHMAEDSDLGSVFQ